MNASAKQRAFLDIAQRQTDKHVRRTPARLLYIERLERLIVDELKSAFDLDVALDGEDRRHVAKYLDARKDIERFDRSSDDLVWIARPTSQRRAAARLEPGDR